MHRLEDRGVEPVDAEFSPWWPSDIAVRADGGAWVTDLAHDLIVTYSPSSGASLALQLPEGTDPFDVAEDVARERLYWLASGSLWSASIADGLLGEPTLIHDPIDDAPSGLARDVCGNYYLLGRDPAVQDGFDRRLVRLELDEAGAVVDREVPLLEYGEVSSEDERLRFGRGFGSGLDLSLFTQSRDGEVLVIGVGVGGAG